LSHLPESIGYWIGAALLLFWFVGAYNRLVRLRSAALQAYATLDAALVRQLEFVQARAVVVQTITPEGEATATSDATPGDVSVDTAAYASLRASTSQLATLLGATRVRPLDPAGMAALGTALHVMLTAWQRLHPDAVISFDADGILSRPATLADKRERHGGRRSAAVSHEGDSQPSVAALIAWPEPSAAAEMARSQFNTAVMHYNASISQFPALLVAWVMQLHSAAPLR